MSPLARLLFPRQAAREKRIMGMCHEVRRMILGGDPDPDRVVADVNAAIRRRRVRAVAGLVVLVTTVGLVTVCIFTCGCGPGR